MSQKKYETGRSLATLPDCLSMLDLAILNAVALCTVHCTLVV